MLTYGCTGLASVNAATPIEQLLKMLALDIIQLHKHNFYAPPAHGIISFKPFMLRSICYSSTMYTTHVEIITRLLSNTFETKQ